MVAARMVARRAHPSLDLVVYDYTARCVYDRVWNHETMTCRGLVVNGAGEVVARPFAKFFNADEHESLPTEGTCEVTEKLDGSLGILYPAERGWALTTRGSFSSAPAVWATRHYRAGYGGPPGPDGVTLLFEIVYPANRVVVDYGERAELVLLAAIDTATGADAELPPDWPGPVAERVEVPAADWRSACCSRALAGTPEGEGWVVRFLQGGLRVKVKRPEYLHLHRLFTGVTVLDVWERLAAGKPVSELAEQVPDEFHSWLRAVEERLRSRYREVEAACRVAATSPRVDPADRRATAAWVAICGANTAVVWRMIDGRDYESLIWRQVRPAGYDAAATFRTDLEP